MSPLPAANAPVAGNLATPPAPVSAPADSAAPVQADQSIPAPAAPEKSTVVATPVESGGELQGIDPDSIGLLTAEGGGLGAAMWQGTPLELVDRLLSSLTLPTVSPTLNGLAQRFLLTTANVPEGPKASDQSLTAMRVEKLVMLGDAADAWNLAMLAKQGQIDEITLRLVAESALVSSASKDVCEKLPGIIKNYTSPEWQKSLIVCQLRANDTKGAQLALEVLHSQGVRDEIFFQLAEHNILNHVKSLPRQLTPLKPLNLALLRIIDPPLPAEVYAHPDAGIIPELLKAKAHDEGARLALAERAAAREIISSADLTTVYRSLTFAPDDLNNPRGNNEAPAHLRARLYQAAMQEKSFPKKFNDAGAFMQSLDAASLNGAAARAMADMISNIPPSGDYAAYSVMAMRIFILAGKPNEALGWLNAAKQSAAAAPNMNIQLKDPWPIIVLAGIESDGDYGKAFPGWLDDALKNADQARREQIGNLLMLFEAAGFSVPEEAWAHVVGQASGERKSIPPSPLLLDRLRMAGKTNRRGEAVLLALAIADNGSNEISLLPVIETVRALRLIGLTADALALARETASVLLMTEPAKP